MGIPDQLVPPSPPQRFTYWEKSAVLVLPSTHPVVTLEYLTEPPYGDPLYKLTVDGVTVGGPNSPIGFFARDMHLSPCFRFLAATSLRQDVWLHVIDLIERKYWSRHEFVRIESVSSSPSIQYRPYIRSHSPNAQYGELTVVSLAEVAWFDITAPIVEKRPARRSRT